jgi:hypothetical protein
LGSILNLISIRAPVAAALGVRGPPAGVLLPLQLFVPHPTLRIAASASCKANIACARELMAALMADVDPPAVLDTADPDATTDHRPPCPCCGGHMSLSRSLRAAPHRAARPRVVPGPGLRHHDDRSHFITRREMPLPVLQPRCLRAAEHSRCIARHTNTALPKIAIAFTPTAAVGCLRSSPPTVASLAQAASPSSRLGRRPPHRPRGFLPWRLSDAGPKTR